LLHGQNPNPDPKKQKILLQVITQNLKLRKPN
jgi:hypothetical protein